MLLVEFVLKWDLGGSWWSGDIFFFLGRKVIFFMVCVKVSVFMWLELFILIVLKLDRFWVWNMINVCFKVSCDSLFL